MPSPLLFTYTAYGIFFLTGLLTGVWKYYHIHSSKEAQAPVYVNIAHRTSLMYSFATLVLAKFVELSPYSEAVTFWSAAAPILFFALAISTYVIHGVLRDTDNQMKRPHKLGSFTLPNWVVIAFMSALIIAEIGGFAILFTGFLSTL
ncbi:hypothetical protein CRI94_14305 [Longibacter salinarum]|uniref:Uncharacterized protein n=1 Tax=Longibacter salinarum TaxID=1850348 RepID=A0A2A8CUT2_9BACT|nr:hypothetical protein [Longibacter salinarum]PEN12208.1 hypothetical protein CRI94_14305 [Longibacter salinarum]